MIFRCFPENTKKNIYDHSTLKKLEAHNYRCFITPISRELFSENHARSDTYDNFFKSNYKKSKNIIYMENSIDEIFKLFSNLEDGINEFRKIKKALDKNL